MKACRMNRTMVRRAGWIVMLASAATAMASDAETSARATGGRRGVGSATGTARYEGDAGFARTETRSGGLNRARSVAVGVDEDGLSLSLSTATATRRGPAVATNFNMSIDNNGSASFSFGRSLASGGSSRTAEAGGRATTGAGGARTASLAGGKTLDGGHVRAHTYSENHSRLEKTPRRVLVVR